MRSKGVGGSQQTLTRKHLELLPSWITFWLQQIISTFFVPLSILIWVSVTFEWLKLQNNDAIVLMSVLVKKGKQFGISDLVQVEWYNETKFRTSHASRCCFHFDSEPHTLHHRRKEQSNDRMRMRRKHKIKEKKFCWTCFHLSRTHFVNAVIMRAYFCFCFRRRIDANTTSWHKFVFIESGENV